MFTEEEEQAGIQKMRSNIRAAARQAKADPATLCVEYTVEQHTPEAEMMLHHLGRWPEILGVAEVRVSIRA